MTLASKMRGIVNPAAAVFAPETDITWHSLWYGHGPNMAAQSYNDNDDVGTWPNETAETDLTQATAVNKPHYEASNTNLNNQPGVEFDGSDTHVLTTSFTTDPVYSSTMLTVVFVLDDKGTQTLGYLMRAGASADHQIWTNDSTDYRTAINHGTSQSGTGTLAGAHFIRVLFDSDAVADKSYVDESLDVNANAGTTTTFPDLQLGNRSSDLAREFNGTFALVGIYEGDLSADSEWSNFKTWLNDEYGFSL